MQGQSVQMGLHLGQLVPMRSHATNNGALVKLSCMPRHQHAAGPLRGHTQCCVRAKLLVPVHLKMPSMREEEE